MNREQRLEELLKRLVEEVDVANECLEGYFNSVAREVNSDLADLGLPTVEVVEED